MRLVRPYCGRRKRSCDPARCAILATEWTRAGSARIFVGREAGSSHGQLLLRAFIIESERLSIKHGMDARALCTAECYVFSNTALKKDG